MGQIVGSISLKPKKERKPPTPAQIYRRHYRHLVMDMLGEAAIEVGHLPHCDQAKKEYEKATGDHWHKVIKADGDEMDWVDRLVSWTIQQYGRMPATNLH